MSEAATLAGYVVIVAAMVVCQVASVVSDRIPTLGQALSAVARRRTGRWLLLAGWLWTGWHLFVRSQAGG